MLVIYVVDTSIFVYSVILVDVGSFDSRNLWSLLEYCYISLLVNCSYLRKLKIEEHKDKYIKNLSGGTQRKVCVFILLLVLIN